MKDPYIRYITPVVGGTKEMTDEEFREVTKLPRLSILDEKKTGGPMFPDKCVLELINEHLRESPVTLEELGL